MGLKHVLLVFAAAFLLEAAVFATYYDDLLFLRRPFAASSAASSAAFTRHATRALSRGRLTVEHLETIVEGARSIQRPDLEVLALERKLHMDGGQPGTSLRLADALRRAGEPVKAERVYLELLSGTSAKEAQ